MGRSVAIGILSVLAIGLHQFLGLAWAAAIAGTLGVLLLYGWWEDGHFRRRGVKSMPLWVPFIGHVFEAIARREHGSEMMKRIYNAFPNDRYIGVKHFTQPLVLITDLELIKQITVKDFDHFQDHNFDFNEEIDPIIGNSLGALHGQKWRDMRATLSPAFTSSKMRGMFQFVVECGSEMITYLEEELKRPENKNLGYFETELKDIFTRCTNDVVASSIFGIKVNTLKNRDNEFYTLGIQASKFTALGFFKFFFAILAPRIWKAFKFTLLPAKVSTFFKSLVSDTMKTREEQNILRPDMIELLMQAKKGSLEYDERKEEYPEAGFATVEESTLGKKANKRKWTDDELIAQAVVFFFAGFEMTSNLLCFVAHELAVNPEVQQKLHDEVDEVAAKSNGKPSYTDVLSMKYLDMVISETLRYWPGVVVLDRKCVKEYTLPPPNDTSSKGLTLKPNDGIWIPVHSMHHDPKYFENPKKFDPERFSEENKGSINFLTYLPFGIGPRNCIASRFALMEVKALTFQIMHKFDLIPTSKTSNPMKIKKFAFNFTPENGFWVGLKSRNV